MNQNMQCRLLCGTKAEPSWDGDDSDVYYRISQEYFIHLIMDNLPCATQFKMPDTGEFQYEPGFRLGFIQENKMFINNHLKFILSYHKVEDSAGDKGPMYRVVGFRVETTSVDMKSYEFDEKDASCKIKENHGYQEILENQKNK